MVVVGPRALFGLLVRTAGLVIFTLSISDLVHTAVSAVLFRDAVGDRYWAQWLTFFVATLIKVGIGMYCLFKPQHLVNWLMPLGQRACGECGYNLKGSPGPTCPECGAAVTRENESAEYGEGKVSESGARERASRLP